MTLRSNSSMQKNIHASYAIQSYCCSYNRFNQQYDGVWVFSKLHVYELSDICPSVWLCSYNIFITCFPSFLWQAPQAPHDKRLSSDTMKDCVCVCDIFYIKFSGKQKTSTQPPTNQPTHQPTNPNHPILGCSTTEFLSHFAFPPSTTTASLPGARNFRRKNGAKAWRRRGRCGESPPTSVAWGMGTEKLFCHWSMTMKIYMKNNRIKCSLKQVIGITSQKSIHL